MAEEPSLEALNEPHISIPVILVCSSEQGRNIQSGSKIALAPSNDGLNKVQPSQAAIARKNKQNIALRLFKASTSETTLHGIRYLFDSNSFLLRRVLWLLVVLVCAGFCAFQFYTRAEKYMKNSELVNLDAIVTNKMDFPSIVICNKNMFKMTKLKEDRSFFLDLFSIERIEPNPEKQLGYLNQRNTKLNNLTKEYIDRGHELQDMLVSCSFVGTKCTADNFKRIITEYGICYEFVGNGTHLAVNNPGVGSGLMLVLDAEHFDYSASFQNSAGFYLSIRDVNEALLLRETSIAIPVGFETLVGLDLTEMVGNPEDDCSGIALMHHSQYSVTACRLECLTEYVVQNCGCKGAYMPGNNYSECPFNLQFTCVRIFANNFTQSAAAKSCVCPAACVTRIYTPITSLAPLSSSRARSLALDVRSRNNQVVGRDFIAVYDFIKTSPKDQAHLYSLVEVMENVHQVALLYCGILKSFLNQTNAIRNVSTSSDLSKILQSISSTSELLVSTPPSPCNNTELLSATTLEEKFWHQGKETFFQQLLNNDADMFENMRQLIGSLTSELAEGVYYITEFIRPPEQVDDKCNAIIKRNALGGMLQFPSSDVYLNDACCTWIITSDQPNTHIEMVVQWKNMLEESDSLEIRLPNKTSLRTISGTSNVPESILLPYNQVVLKFKSGSSYSGLGFAINYVFLHTGDKCNATNTHDASGGLLTFAASGLYDSDVNCVWKIGTNEINRNIELAIHWNDNQEEEANCTSVALEIRLLNDTNLLTICGSNNATNSIVLPYSYVILVFRSNSSKVFNGFAVEYLFFEDTDACSAIHTPIGKGGILSNPPRGLYDNYVNCLHNIGTDEPNMYIKMDIMWRGTDSFYEKLVIVLPGDYENIAYTFNGSPNTTQSLLLPHNKVVLMFYSDSDYVVWDVTLRYVTTPAPGIYLGCFLDKPMPERDLSYELNIDGDNSVENCISQCKRRNYRYAGLQLWNMCYCGNRYGKYDNQVARNDSECIACPENKYDKCGSTWRNSIYSINDRRPQNVSEIDSKLVNLTEIFGELKAYHKWLMNAFEDLIDSELKQLRTYFRDSNGRRSSEHVIDVDYVRNNLVIVEVFFNQLRYQSLQKESSDSTISLICDLGGIFGLCLGASIMSFYEIIDFCVAYLYFKWRC